MAVKAVPMGLLPYRARHPKVEAQLFEEETALHYRGLEIVVPAGHYFAAYQGGVIVLPQEDFEALFGLDEGPSFRCYQ